MIDNTYNQGFGSEKEVVIYSVTPKGKEGYEMWDGYFENLLRGCYNDKIVKGGILYGYMTLTEWQDESPWRIENVYLALNELTLFSEQNMQPKMDCMSKELREIQEKLLILLKDAVVKGYDVYIEYD
ncbi:MAG: hypothetical protein BGN88_04975 [Clostridiales bacterium 43-6]|nr:MAG: hypothetical protein BGN88_04975 [Clostridiales bacterium 43-6]